MSIWETQRGDEWWFNDHWCEADGSANIQAGTFSISDIRSKTGQLTKERLHALLFTTQQQFADTQVYCVASDVVLPLLELLSGANVIRFTVLSRPYSPEVQLVSVVPPVDGALAASGRQRQRRSR